MLQIARRVDRTGYPKQEKPANPNAHHVKETDVRASRIKCRCGVRRVKCGMWSVKCGMESVECEVQSVECKV